MSPPSFPRIISEHIISPLRNENPNTPLTEWNTKGKSNYSSSLNHTHKIDIPRLRPYEQTKIRWHLTVDKILCKLPIEICSKIFITISRNVACGRMHLKNPTGGRSDLPPPYDPSRMYAHSFTATVLLVYLEFYFFSPFEVFNRSNCSSSTRARAYRMRLVID